MLSFKDIRHNGYHIETANDNGLYIILNVSTKKANIGKIIFIFKFVLHKY